MPTLVIKRIGQDPIVREVAQGTTLKNALEEAGVETDQRTITMDGNPVSSYEEINSDTIVSVNKNHKGAN